MQFGPKHERTHAYTCTQGKNEKKRSTWRHHLDDEPATLGLAPCFNGLPPDFLADPSPLAVLAVELASEGFAALFAVVVESEEVEEEEEDESDEALAVPEAFFSGGESVVLGFSYVE